MLQYSGGSPCGADAKSGKDKDKEKDKKGKGDDKDKRGVTVPYEYDDEDAALIPHLQDKEKDDDKNLNGDNLRRKSATISFLCDRDPTNTQATFSFIGTDPDECAYFFEARSSHACAHAEPHKPGSVGPGSVFGLIVLIAILVYVLGGVFYNRTVAHARGWRQLPNYSLWAGIWSFICVRSLRRKTGLAFH